MKFEIGEIALFRSTVFARFNGEEVTIQGYGPQWEGRQTYYVDASAAFLAAPGGRWVTEDCLHKRQQPPDWEKLADPRSLPLDDKLAEPAFL